ncbi:MAG TPA: hypothetical protein VN730_09105 [Steroidobacteraceae bacterium]|nr:hypothetical protein [Steroidobacteraceae bacterium]
MELDLASLERKLVRAGLPPELRGVLEEVFDISVPVGAAVDARLEWLYRKST